MEAVNKASFLADSTVPKTRMGIALSISSVIGVTTTVTSKMLRGKRVRRSPFNSAANTETKIPISMKTMGCLAFFSIKQAISRMGTKTETKSM